MYLSEVSDLGNPSPFYSDTEKLDVFLEISVFSKTMRGSQINTDVCTFKDYFFNLIKNNQGNHSRETQMRQTVQLHFLYMENKPEA